MGFLGVVLAADPRESSGPATQQSRTLHMPANREQQPFHSIVSPQNETAGEKLLKEFDDDASEHGCSESIIALFDSLCVSFGDQDAILLLDPDKRMVKPSIDDDNHDYTALEPTSVCYLELQEASLNLASQLWFRYRPDYVLVECFGHAVAEAVSVLACMRIKVPFVPVELVGPSDPNKQSRVEATVRALQQDQNIEKSQIVAICCCDGDEDPVLGVLHQANVHRIVYVDPLGNLLESIRVPYLRPSTSVIRNQQNDDELYVLFTSGTTSAQKAVVGSQLSTFRRLAWWRDTFSASPRIARRTKLTFVDGITELLSALLHPPSVLVSLTQPHRLAHEGVAVLLDLEPTQITLLPSQLEQLLLALKNQLSEGTLQRIICSGEMFPAHLWDQVQRFNISQQGQSTPLFEVINLYGQTESTGDVLCAVLTDLKPESVVQKGVVAVGTPIRDDIVVSHSLSKGELSVSGNLAVRYLNDSSNLKDLDTGDVGFCEEGVWYVRGRRNEVEKVSGVWTSPSEVEWAVAQVFSVQGAIAAAVVDGQVFLVSEHGIPDFSRERMRNTGLPWNVIPHRVFRHSVPIQQSAAGKIDRQALRNLISSMMGKSDSADQSSEHENESKGKGAMDLVNLVGSVLNLPNAQIDPTSSFVNLGGDSTTAVTLLYHLQAKGFAPRLPHCVRVTAVDILAASSLLDFSDWLEGKRPLKRAKRDAGKSTKLDSAFCPMPPLHISPCHVAIQFQGCVDASPTVSQDGKSLFIGCQGGVIQRVCLEAFAVVAHRCFPGWMVQADCVATKDSVIVSLYNRRNTNGRLVSLSLDLETVHWMVDVDGTVRSTPVPLDESTLCVNVGESSLLAVDISTGNQLCAATSLETLFSKPAVLRSTSNGRVVAVYGDGRGESIIVSTLSRDESGTHLEVTKLVDELVESIGPVHKDACVRPGGTTVLLSGSVGSLLQFSLDTTAPLMEYSKAKSISEYPLSPPEPIGNTDVVVGSYDGFAHISSSTRNQSVYVGASVYCKPLALPDGTFIICTTAGDVVRICDDHVVWRYRVEAEIWSNPVLVDEMTYKVVVGGRDSRLHIVSIGGGERASETSVGSG